MGYEDRLNSVRKEIDNGTESDLQDDTGHTVDYWQRCIYLFFKYMWPSPQAFLDQRSNVVLQYAYASALYEWSQVDWRDRAGDSYAHGKKGSRFDESPGAGASIGWFQGYAKESYEALRLYPGLRKELRQLYDDFAKSIDPSMDEPVTNRVVMQRGMPKFPVASPPTPKNIRVLVYDEDEKLRTFLSWYKNLDNPYVSLIGKIKLSVDYATDTMIYNPSKYPLWRLPDAALRYVMLTYEMTGGDRDWLNATAAIIGKADSAYEAAKRSGNDAEVQKARNAELNFTWHKDKPAKVLSILDIQPAGREKCRYHELRQVS